MIGLLGKGTLLMPVIWVVFGNDTLSLGISAHSIQSSLMQAYGRSLDEESLTTIMAETEVILNS